MHLLVACLGKYTHIFITAHIRIVTTASNTFLFHLLAENPVTYAANGAQSHNRGYLLSEPPYNYPLSFSNLRKWRIVSALEDSGRWSAGFTLNLSRVKSRKRLEGVGKCAAVSCLKFYKDFERCSQH